MGIGQIKSGTDSYLNFNFMDSLLDLFIYYLENLFMSLSDMI